MYIRSFDGLKIYYHKKSPKKPKGTLLFIHGGFFGNHTLMKNLYSRYPDYRIIAPDMRGKGRSEIPEKIEGTLLEDYAKDLYEILKKEKLKKTSIIAASFGGIISLKFAEMFKDKIDIEKIVMISSSYKTSHAKKKFILKKIALPIIKGSVKLLEHIWIFPEQKKMQADYSEIPSKNFHLRYGLCLLRSNSIKDTIRRYRFLFNVMDFEIDIKSIESFNFPILLIYGSKDHIFPYSHQEELKEHAKMAQIKVIKGKGHNIYLHNPEDIETTVNQFMTQHSSSKNLPRFL